MKRKRTRILWTIALTTALSVPTACICVLPAYADEGAAAAMQLAKTEGTVSVTSGSEKEVPLVDKMRLYNGYQVETMKESYAWIELDRVKMAKLDAASEVSIRKRGKKLEILLGSGNVFFNVTEPLAADESLNIRTATMVAGIRGTSGWVEVTDENHVQISVLEGSVEVSVSDPVTGESRMDTVSGGQTALCTVNPQMAEGEKLGIERRAFSQEEIGGFILTEVAADASLAEKIFEKGGMDLRSVTAQEAQDQLKKDEATVAQKLAEAETALTGQAAQAQAQVQPTWANAANHAANAADSWQPDDSASTYVPPVETKPAPNSPSTITLPATATVDEVNEALNKYSVVIIESPEGSMTIPSNTQLIVPSGKTLEVRTGMTIQENDVPGEPGGSLGVLHGATLVLQYGVKNSGTIENAGVIQGTVVMKSPETKGSGFAYLSNTGTIDGGNGSALIIEGDYNLTIQAGLFTTKSAEPTLECVNINKILFQGGYIQNKGSGLAIRGSVDVQGDFNNQDVITTIRTKSNTIAQFGSNPTTGQDWKGSLTLEDGEEWFYLPSQTSGQPTSQSSEDIEALAFVDTDTTTSDNMETPSDAAASDGVATLPESQPSDGTATPPENPISGGTATPPGNQTSGGSATPSENQTSGGSATPPEAASPDTTTTQPETQTSDGMATPSETPTSGGTTTPPETQTSDDEETPPETQTSDITATPSETQTSGDQEPPAT